MEAPDAKRLRLDHEPAGYHPPGHSARPATAPVIPASHHSSHTEHPLGPAGHSYTAPSSTAPPPVHLSGPLPSTQSHGLNGVDAHRPPYPATSPPVPPNHQPGYVVGPSHQHSSYPLSAHQASAQTSSAGSDSRRTSSAGPPSMAEHTQHHGLPTHPPGQQTYPPPMEAIGNGVPPNGIAYQAHDQYAVGPVAHHPGYPPTPTSAYHPGPMYTQGPSNYAGQPRRKQVRATQACNHCRARKQKCDENRPCGYCSNEGIKCEYREVPPPKTDRHIMQLLDQQRDIVDQIGEMRQMQVSMNQLLQQSAGKFDPTASKLMSPAQFDAGDQSRYPGMIRTDVKDADPGPEAEEPPPDQDQPPSSHETGAQYLVQWPFIGQYFRNAGITSVEYVHEETERSGTLRPYGSSKVDNGTIMDAAFDDEWDEVTGEQKTEDSLENMWGDGPQTRGLNNGPNTGGGNPDGSLDLTSDMVYKLYDSYMRNMWVMHPFLDARWLHTKIEEFVTKHSPYVHNQPGEGHFAMPGMPASSGRPDTPSSTTGKRKRPSNASEDTTEYSSTENTRGRWHAPRRAPDRSMQNAIILLVLALGKVLMEERFLLEEFATKTPSADSSEMSYANSPYDAAKPSPRSYMAYETASSPGDIKSAAMARGASMDGPRARKSRRNGHIANVELFPGLAYFAQASDILGNNLGGNTILHAQAYLLAGIYYGQLGRVTESWSWINEGCRVTTILHNKKKYRDHILSRHGDKLARSNELDPQCTLVSILCWSALQLESDLRAELDQLPKPSQLMYSEPKIVLPARLVGADAQIPLYHGPDLVSEDILHSYHFQIQFRLTLNRVHTALYSKKSRIPQNQSKKTTVVWSDADTGILFHNLQNTRSFLGNATKYWWHDGEALSTNLLEARLRAKYYGAEYIILRPYIYNALRWQQDTGGLPPRLPFDLAEWVKNYNETERHAAARRADRRANGLEPEIDEVKLRKAEISYERFQNDPDLATQFLWCCKRCIDAAMASTEAFDGVADPLQDLRLRVTNIHGTATAQFSNMLVLVAVARSWLAVMVDTDRLKRLMTRTIALHDKLSPLAPIFRTNRKILAEAAAGLYEPEVMAQRGHAAWQASPSSGHGSHQSMSPASGGTPRAPYGPPPPTSAHSSFSSIRY